MWPWLALIGIALSALTFGGAWSVTRGKTAAPQLWPRLAILSFFSAVPFGWAIERVPIESYSVGGWIRSLALIAIAAAAPIVCAAACAEGRSLPVFSWLLGRRGGTRDRLGVALVVVFIALTLVAVEEVLGLVFDPRYRDFIFAPLTAAVIPFLALMLSAPRQSGTRAIAETASAAVLVLCALYILPNESFANWQSIWFCAAILALALILERARDAPGSG